MISYNIKNTCHGLQFDRSPIGEKGNVKGATPCRRSIKINHWPLKYSSLVKFINSQLDPAEPKLQKGFLGIGGASKEKIHSSLLKILKIEEEIIEESSSEEELPPEIEVNSQEEPVIEKPFTDQLSEKQDGLYDSLGTNEKELYEHVFKLGASDQFPGIFADLLLSLIKGRVLNFKMVGNDLTIQLAKGHAIRKLMGFELKGSFPDQVTLRYSPENQKLSFINSKIPFYYLGSFILNPEYMVLTPQGVKVKAEFGFMAKASGEHKRLDAPLTSDGVFDLFSVSDK